jgi:Rrf2 family protein
VHLSRKSEYALRAMLDLSLHGTPGRPVRTADIAARAGVPAKYLETILVELRRAGLVHSRRGPEGGHELAAGPSQVTVERVREAVEGPLALWPRARPGRRRADAVEEALRACFREAETGVRALLARTTLEDIARQAAAREGAADFAI